VTSSPGTPDQILLSPDDVPAPISVEAHAVLASWDRTSSTLTTRAAIRAERRAARRERLLIVTAMIACCLALVTALALVIVIASN